MSRAPTEQGAVEAPDPVLAFDCLVAAGCIPVLHNGQLRWGGEDTPDSLRDLLAAVNARVEEVLCARGDRIMRWGSKPPVLEEVKTAAPAPVPDVKPELDDAALQSEQASFTLCPFTAGILEPLAAGHILEAVCGVLGLRDEKKDVQYAAVAAAWPHLTPAGRAWLVAGVGAAERWYSAHGTPVAEGAGWPPEGAGEGGTVGVGAEDGPFGGHQPAVLAVNSGLCWAERDWAGLVAVAQACRALPLEERVQALPHVLAAAQVPAWSEEDWATASQVFGEASADLEGCSLPEEEEGAVLRAATALWEGRVEEVPIRWVTYAGSDGGRGDQGDVDGAAPTGSSGGGGGATQGSCDPLRRRPPVAVVAARGAGPSPVATATEQARGSVAVVSASLPPPRPFLVTDAEEFRRVLAATEGAPVVGLDTETTGLDPHVDRVRTIQLATGDAAWVVDAWEVRDIGALRDWLAARARAGLRTVAHNAKFDLSMLRAALGGAPLAEVAVSDPMLWSQLLACGLPVDGGHGLAAVVKRWLGVELPKEEQKGDWTGPLRPEQVAYAARDAWTLVPLADAMQHGVGGRKGVIAEGLARVAALEDACVLSVADMEYDGIAFDLPYWGGLTAEIRAEAAAAKAEALRVLVPESAGRPAPVGRQKNIFGEVMADPDPVNLDSPAQVLAALRALGLEVDGTAEAVLKPLAADNPGVAALLRYKKQSKLLSAFGEAMPKHVNPQTGRIHAHYHQLCANGVGRFSCSGPNVQQVPHDPRFRKAFVAPEGRRLVIADLSQIELRIMAKLSGDKRMLEAYRNGEDLHRLTASLVAGVPLAEVTKAQRQMSKAVNFGLCYGMSANGLRTYALNSYGVAMSQEDAETFRRRYFEAYSGVTAFHWRQDREARGAMETRTLLGRCRRWADANMGLPELANSPDQGTGADILKRAMVLVRPTLLRAGAHLVASVHDELVVEAPEGCADEVKDAVRDALISAGVDLLETVPVDAEAAVGATWADKA